MDVQLCNNIITKYFLLYRLFSSHANALMHGGPCGMAVHVPQSTQYHVL